ncbi:MAG: thiosulfate oxidation carrier complex protein SoxZ [Sulfurimonas sp.]|jgi:sulfur-oxidizing protein SoxZ|nr:thiosulfate oxidation carrier complex protein SoxZ [Sulfurimonadaceae bacterium]
MAGIKTLIKINPNKYKKGDLIKVSFMAMHPMETGLRVDKKSGKVVPADYIKSAKFEYNDKVFSTMNIWETVSANPVLSTYLRVEEAGEIKVSYSDNKGVVGESRAKINPKG